MVRQLDRSLDSVPGWLKLSQPYPIQFQIDWNKERASRKCRLIVKWSLKAFRAEELESFADCINFPGIEVAENYCRHPFAAARQIIQDSFHLLKLATYWNPGLGMYGINPHVCLSDSQRRSQRHSSSAAWAFVRQDEAANIGQRICAQNNDAGFFFLIV